MHYPEIPNFYFANLEAHPFSEDFDGPVESLGCINFLVVDFVGGPFFKKYPNFDL